MKKFLLFLLLAIAIAIPDLRAGTKTAVLLAPDATYSSQYDTSVTATENSSQTKYTYDIDNSSISIEFSKAAIYKTASNDGFRIYASTTLTVTPSKNIVINAISFKDNYSTSSSAPNVTISSGGGSINPSTATAKADWKWTGNSTSAVVLSISKQLRCNYIVVEYTVSDPAPEAVSCSLADADGALSAYEGQTVTFTSAHATQLKVYDLTDNKTSWLQCDDNGNAEYTVEFGNSQGLYIQVTPCQGDTEYADKAKYFSIGKINAPKENEPESVTCSVGDVEEFEAYEGQEVTFTSKNADKLVVTDVSNDKVLATLITDDNGSASYEISFNGAEEIMITVTPYQEETAYEDQEAMYYITHIEAPSTDPHKVTCSLGDGEDLEATEGQVITFTSTNADRIVISDFISKETIGDLTTDANGSASFTVRFNGEDILMITATPYKGGVAFGDYASDYEIDRKAAPAPGMVKFAIDDVPVSSNNITVSAGAKLSMSAENAARILYSIDNDQEEIEYKAPIEINNAMTVTAYAENSEGTTSDDASELTIAIKKVETMSFTKVNSITDLKDGASYIVEAHGKAMFMGRTLSNTAGGYMDTVMVYEYYSDGQLGDIITFPKEVVGRMTSITLENLNKTTNGHPQYALKIIDDSANAGNYFDIASADNNGKLKFSDKQVGFETTITESSVTFKHYDLAANIQYNASSPRFTSYKTSSNQTALTLYRLMTDADFIVGAIKAVGYEGSEIEVSKGTVISFQADGAAKMKFEIAGHEGAYEANANKDGIASYTVDFPGQAQELTLTVTAYHASSDATSTATFTITRAAAALCGDIKVTPTSGNDLKVGSIISIECENAVVINYTINGGEDQEYTEPFAITDNDFDADGIILTIVALNCDGEATDPFTATYGRKAADQYIWIKRMNDIAEDGKYILFGEGTDEAKKGLMGAQGTTTKYRDIIEETKKEDVFVVDDDKYSSLAILTLNKSDDKYTIYIAAENRYLGSSNADFGYYDTATDNSKWDMSFNEDGSVRISHGDNILQFNKRKGDERFKTYTSDQGPVYLYRLIEKDYEPEAPQVMYIHGHFWDRHYDLSRPVVMMPSDDDANVLVARDILIGGNKDHLDKPLSYVFTTHCLDSAPAPEAARRRSAAAETSQWAELTEGTVYHAAGKHAAADVVDGTEITPFSVKESDLYTLTADFNGYTPMFTATARGGVTTGVESVAADSDTEVEYFNLQGLRIERPAKGIYVQRQGSTSKLVIK